MLETERSASSAAVRPPGAAAALTHPLCFHGSGAAFFVLVLKNTLLTLLTLGLYLPWARSERRRYLWKNIEIAGHRLRYHGTGKELWVAYAKVLLGYLVFLALPLLVSQWLGSSAGLIVLLAMFAAVMALFPYALWGSLRYLLGRTSYRAARFRHDGELKAFARVLVGGSLLTLLTFGFYAPVWSNRIFRELTNAAALGSKHFEYRGESRVVFRMALKALLLSLLTFGLYFFWYQAALQRYRFASTHFDGAHGQLELTGMELLQLKLLKIFALTLTLGLAFPWLTVYTLRFYLARMRFVGPVDFARIHQTDSGGDATADGLADALDVGIAH